jgi:glyoxylase-like metal-dependent hydrolase (beta-lactamase superfamily II)
MHLGTIDLKSFRIDVIDGGACWMDGGAIFGVVPKPLWSKLVPVDADNRVRLSFFSLLARSDDVTLVIEGGAAAHQPPKVREAMMAGDSSLVSTLASLGVAPEDVDFFIPSHLHFDHVGGATDPVTGDPVFPRAKYVFQTTEWKEANNPCGINVNAYLPGDIKPLAAADLHLVDGDVKVAPGVRVRRVGGHSVGSQMVIVGGGGSDSLVFTGDIVPTSEHISPRWMCAFDIFPAETYDVKVDLLRSAAEKGFYVAPGHGGNTPVCTVSAGPQGRFLAQRVAAVGAPG